MFLREAEKSKRVRWLREVVNYRVTLRFVQVNQKAVFLAVKPLHLVSGMCGGSSSQSLRFPDSRRATFGFSLHVIK